MRSYWEGVLDRRGPEDHVIRPQKVLPSDGKPYPGPGPPDEPPAPPTKPKPPEPVIDWKTYLGFYIDDPGLVTQIADFVKNHGDDPDLQPKLIALVRGSKWWSKTFVGFWAGYKAGVFSDESGYRSWYTQANSAFRKHYGRDLSSSDLLNFLTHGYSPGEIEQIGAGHAYVEANRADIQYTSGAFGQGRLTADELQAYGEQQAGRSSSLGARIKQRVDAALAKAERVFSGTLATPSLQIGASGLSAPSLNPKQKPDIGA